MAAYVGAGAWGSKGVRCVASQASVRSFRCVLAHVRNHTLTRTPAPHTHTHPHFFRNLFAFHTRFQKVSLPKNSGEVFSFWFWVFVSKKNLKTLETPQPWWGAHFFGERRSVFWTLPPTTLPGSLRWRQPASKWLCKLANKESGKMISAPAPHDERPMFRLSPQQSWEALDPIKLAGVFQIRFSVPQSGMASGENCWRKHTSRPPWRSPDAHQSIRPINGCREPASASPGQRWCLELKTLSSSCRTDDPRSRRDPSLRRREIPTRDTSQHRSQGVLAVFLKMLLDEMDLLASQKPSWARDWQLWPNPTESGASPPEVRCEGWLRGFWPGSSSECAPLQCALSTRAGTDCVGHFLRAATDADPQATILSVDGVVAYDHVLRPAMLERLLHVPKARTILPFLRLSYGSPSSYSWEDDVGKQRTITQAEGGEQGDPLMPLLLSGARGTGGGGGTSGGRGTTVCIPGWRERALPATPCRPSVQVVARVSGPSRGHQTPRRQDEGLEQEWDSARGHRRCQSHGSIACALRSGLLKTELKENKKTTTRLRLRTIWHGTICLRHKTNHSPTGAITGTFEFLHFVMFTVQSIWLTDHLQQLRKTTVSRCRMASEPHQITICLWRLAGRAHVQIVFFSNCNLTHCSS